ncbi:MAG: FAD:protein transferase [Actinomycetota bacterium]|nr:FAD:protein transferase [Actinomycetota bacterium]
MRTGLGTVKRVEHIWGTVVSLDVVGDDVADGVVDDVFTWFDRVDSLFSTWRDDSEIVRLARGTLALAQASPETRTVLDLCWTLAAVTDGAFDVGAAALLPPPHPAGWCPLDPSAVVKGWALDRAAEQLQDAGIRRFCMNAGGDVRVGRGPEPGQPWRVGVRHPWQVDRLAAVVEVVDAAVATSGRYERGDHIVDPRSGRPATGLASVTVVSADLATADAYSTAVLALGCDGVDWLAGHGEVDAMAITDDQQVFTTAGFNRHRAR